MTSAANESVKKRHFLRESYPLFLAGQALTPNLDLAVYDKFTGELATRVALADERMIDEAIAASQVAFDEFRRWPSYKRQQVLAHVVKRLTERREELSIALTIEAGKTIKDSRGEVDRAIDTFKIAMEESTRIYGETLPLDITQRSQNYHGYWKRLPIGPCSFISPFNFPVNLVAHKIAPALAVGCSFVLKPASATPIGALILGEILAETDLPAGVFSILPCTRTDADLFTVDERFKLLSFTGSPAVGWALKARAGKKKVILELGGNAACIVDRGVDISDAVDRILIGTFYQSGQSCIGVQRIFAHEEIISELRAQLIEGSAALTMGDPLDEGVFLGPLIRESEAVRIEAWVQQAVDDGATILVGGKRSGAFYNATLLENVSQAADLRCKEAFGPVAILDSFNEFDDVLTRVNDSAFGLQAGLFTNDLKKVHKAFEELEVGGLVINDVPSMRVDNMPYGGVKDSGIGREGIRFAMEDMTEIRLMVFRS